MPEDYAAFVSGVFGLDNRPVANPHIRFRGANRPFGARASTVSYKPPQIAQLYGFPQDATGAGQTVGLIEFGGGYRPADVREYFHDLGQQSPAVKCVSINHAENRPTTPHSADSIVMLDIEMAGAVAPGAGIAVYFAPNNARGFQEAFSVAIHDQLNKPRVLSIGWGNSEVNWSQQSMESFGQLAQEAGLLGITVCVAAGETVSTDGLSENSNIVDFPASCPHVLAAGGTRLIAVNGAIDSETVWNGGVNGGATGGGFSKAFARPPWQGTVVAQSGRGVPDVAGNADPETGFEILVDGHREVVGGTAAAAPLWAGLVILLNQKLNRRLGFINPALYSIDQSSGFHDINLGNNGLNSASYGWDPVTGHGTPMGSQLLQALAEARAQKSEHVHAGSAR